MAINWKISENSDNLEGEKKPGEGGDVPDNREKQLQKESLENHIHEELNSLRDSLNKNRAHEALDSVDWLGRNSWGGKKSKKEPTGTDAIFEKPVDTHVVYKSDVFGYDSARSVAVLAKDFTMDTARLVLHPVREIQNTLDIWWKV